MQVVQCIHMHCVSLNLQAVQLRTVGTKRTQSNAAAMTQQVQFL